MFRAYIYRAGCNFEACEDTPEQARALLMRGVRKYFREANIGVDKHDLRVMNEEMVVREIHTGDCLCDGSQMFRTEKAIGKERAQHQGVSRQTHRIGSEE